MASVASRTSRMSGRSTVTSSSSSMRDDAWRTLHEGWAERYSVTYQQWYRYWMILTDTELQFYSVNVSGQRQKQMSGRIPIGVGTRVIDGAAGFNLDLINASNIGEQRERFQFKNENDRDLWKAYVIGLTSGNVPADVNLLPGQLRDVLHAVHKVPSPAPPPPAALHSHLHPCAAAAHSNVDLPPTPPCQPLPSLPQDVASELLPAADYNEDDDDGRVRAYAIGDGRVSVRIADGPTNRSRCLVVENEAGQSATVDNDAGDVTTPPSRGLQQLMTRQSNLAFKTLDGERKFKRGHMMAPFVSHWPPPPSRDLRRCRSQSVGAVGLQAGSGSVRFFVDENTWRERIQRQRQQLLQATTQQATSSDNNNNDNSNAHINVIHPFHADPARNSCAPPWFVDCDREKAESVLLASRCHGSVLMRPSTSNAHTRSYGITMRCDEPSGSRMLHYAVHWTATGFRIAVDNQQRPMFYLSDVMQFFVAVVGLSARPLTAALGLGPPSTTMTSPQPPTITSSMTSPPSVDAVGATTTVVAGEQSATSNVENHIQRLERLRVNELDSQIHTPRVASTIPEAVVTSSSSAGAKSWPSSNRPSPAVSDKNVTNSSSGRQRVVLNTVSAGAAES